MLTLPTLPVLWCRKNKGSLSSHQSAFPAGSSLTPANALRNRAGAPAAKVNASRSRDTGLCKKRLSMTGKKTTGSFTDKKEAWTNQTSTNSS